VLHGRRLRPADREITLSAGDRVSLLISAPQDGHPPDHDDSPDHIASQEASSGSSSL
jgi:hypothetical protein